MKKIQLKLKSLFLIVLFLMIGLAAPAAMAQDAPPPPDEPCDDGECAPIDSYIVIGLLAGAAAGYTLLRKPVMS